MEERAGPARTGLCPPFHQPSATPLHNVTGYCKITSQTLRRNIGKNRKRGRKDERKGH